MNFDTWDLAFNMVLFIFWFRIWASDSRDTFFNHLMGPISRLADSIIRFLSPVFLGLPARIIAVLVFVFLVILRGMAVPYSAVWTLTIGFQRGADTSNLFSCILFSVLSFAVFLFKIWGISLIYVRTGAAPYNHAAGTLFHVSLPFTRIRPEYRPITLLAIGMVLVGLTDYFGNPQLTPHSQYYIQGNIGWGDNPLLLILVKLCIVALAGWTGVLTTLAELMIFLIVVSWIAMFANSVPIRMFCREGIDFLLGPLRKHPIVIGMLDITPIIFFFIIQLVQGLLMAILINSFNKL